MASSEAVFLCVKKKQYSPQKKRRAPSAATEKRNINLKTFTSLQHSGQRSATFMAQTFLILIFTRRKYSE